MFTPEQALRLPEGLQNAFADDVNKFFIAYAEACEEFRAEGIKAKQMDMGYPARSWQQVAELLHFFTKRKLQFAFEFTSPVPVNDGLYSITGYVYGLYGIARIPVYSGSHVFMPITTYKDGRKRFDDKAVGGAERYIWKNFWLHASGIADGEKDIDNNPPEEYSPKPQLTPKELMWNAMVDKLIKDKVCSGREQVIAIVTSFKSQNGWVSPETQSDYDALYNRIVAEVKAGAK